MLSWRSESPGTRLRFECLEMVLAVCTEDQVQADIAALRKVRPLLRSAGRETPGWQGTVDLRSEEDLMREAQSMM